MNSTTLLALLCVFLSPSALAQEWSSDQLSLWQFVEQSWVDDSKETGKWPGEYVHDNVQNWDSAWPAPRGKSSMAKWTSFRDSTSETLQYELFPHSLVVEGDTGVAFYSVVEVRRDSEGKVERSVTGLVETAVRARNGWKYIGLTSFDIGSNND